MDPRIAVIIPNWNGKEMLAACLVSLDRQTFTDFTVTVVDNASADGSVEMVARQFPGAAVIALPENRGFGRAINAGMRQTGAPYLFLLNNDTEAEPDCLQKLYDCIRQAGPRCAGVQCRMMSHADPQRVDSLGLQLTRGLFGALEYRDIAHAEPFDPVRHGAPGRVIGVCAGAALLRREFLAAAGLFDERFFAVYEDVDLSLRGVRQGWHFVYEPAAVVRHRRSPSITKLAYTKRLETTKNYYLTGFKNFPIGELWRLKLKLLYALQMDMFNLVSHVKKGRYGRTLGMYLSLFRQALPLVAARRCSISRRDLADCIRHSIEKGIW